MIGYALLLNLEEVKITTCHLYFARHGYHYIAKFEDLMNTSMPEALKQFKKLTSFDRNSEITKLIPAKVRSNSNSYNAYWARRIENQCIGKTKDGRRCTQVSKKGQETCYLHDTKNNKQCSGQTQTGERCIYPVKKGQKYCHIHAPLVIQTLSPNEDNLLQEKMKHIQPVPANFWRKIRYGTTKYPTKKGWVSWCRKFSKQHPMWNQKNSYWGSQNEIVLKLMKICNIEKTSVISFLDSRKVDLTLVKSNWDRFWKVHELIFQEQKNNPENTNL